MESISICFQVPASYRDRHLPEDVVVRCYPKAPSSRCFGSPMSSGSCEFSTGKSIHSNQQSQLNKVIRFHGHGQAPSSQFLSADSKVRTCATGGNGQSSELPVPSAPDPFAFESEHKEHEGSLKNSSEDDLGSSPSTFHIEPPFSEQKGAKTKGYLFKWMIHSFAGGYERENFHEDVLSRLKPVRAEAAADKNHSVSVVPQNDHEPHRLADWTGMWHPRALEDKKLRASRKGLRTPIFREIDEKLEHDSKPRNDETGSWIQHSLPPILDRLGFQSPPKVISGPQQNGKPAARVNLKLSYQVSYELETEYGTSDVPGEHDLDRLDHSEIEPNSHSKSSSAKAGGSVACWTLQKGLSSEKMGRTIHERGSLMRSGHSTSRARPPGKFVDPKSYLYAARGGTLGGRAGGPVQNINGADRRRADSQAEPAGNLLDDWLPMTIAGIAAFVICGTCSFAMGHRQFKSEFWLRKTPSMTVAPSTQAPCSMSHMLSQTSGQELTVDSFVDTIQKRYNDEVKCRTLCLAAACELKEDGTENPIIPGPTFVLFYAPWCPHCRLLDPTWKELGNILSSKGYDVQLARLNAEKHPRIADDFKVREYPTLIFFKDGTAVENGQYQGPRETDSFMKFIDENLNPNP